MNLQQLEYIIAVDKHRHFSKAAEACFVTQATLSMMIKKLEEELDVMIFDRSRQPVVPTEAGRQLIAQARSVLKEAALMKQLVADVKQEVKGELRIGIIPTLAPYLLSLFLQRFLEKYPLVEVHISELTTTQITSALAQEKLDVGILATPLQQEGMRENFLFNEPFLVFVSAREKQLKKKYVLPNDIDVKRLWLLEEGHCMRSQMMNLCELRKKEQASNLFYEAGSIESLLRITEMNTGITIVPELATIGFSKKMKQQLRAFRAPVPVREISLVTYRHFTKQRMLEVLKEEILAGVKPVLGASRRPAQVVEIGA